MSEQCRTEGCTVGDTGICLLGNPPESCEFRLNDEADDDEDIEGDVAPVLPPPEQKPSLWGSLPLDLNEVRELMGSRRCVLVGVVGTPGAGKTAALVSLYLLLSHGQLDGYEFAGSDSHLAFEEICQGARRWSATPPEEMTARTEASGGRAAGFLHLQLRRLADGRLLDLLLPDLPGEWSDNLIDSNRVDRLEFVKAADVIWLFVGGADLRSAQLRMHTLGRTKRLLQRLGAMLGGAKPLIKFVVTHADSGELAQITERKLMQMADEVGVSAEVLHIASFADPEGPIAPGYGISALIDKVVPAPERHPFHLPSGTPHTGRFMLRYERADEI